MASSFRDAASRAEGLLLAMAPINDVICAFNIVPPIIDDAAEDARKSDLISDSSIHVEEQDFFAEMVESCWNELGPSQRYLKKLIHQYVTHLEKGGVALESDALLSLVLRASLSKDLLPDADESFYLSFRVPNEKIAGVTGECPLLRIRVYPYHNDVALRLWEAGACLAEYFLQYPSRVAGKRVIELGAGVGLTGLVVAGCCRAKVHLTDYTEECRENLAYNVEINNKWLDEVGSFSEISQGYLEWTAFADSTSEDVALRESMEAIRWADVLVGADVCYDVEVIESLIAVVKCFLMQSPKTKEAIFGITMRQMATFEMFLGHLQKYSIFCEWIAQGSDCESLPKVFQCNFNQPRTDVRIACLTVKSLNHA